MSFLPNAPHASARVPSVIVLLIAGLARSPFRASFLQYRSDRRYGQGESFEQVADVHVGSMPMTSASGFPTAS